MPKLPLPAVVAAVVVVVVIVDPATERDIDEGVA